MGSNVSTASRKVVDVVENSSRSACTMRQAADQNMNVRLDLTDTNCPNLSFINRAKLVGECNMDQIAENLAESTFDLTAEQTAGLGIGINVNTSKDDRTRIIQQRLENECNSEANIKQNLSIDVVGKNLTCNQLQGLNEADATTQCISNVALKTISNDEFVKASKQESDILGTIGKLFTGPLFILGGIILAIGLLFFALRLLRSAGSEATATASTTSTGTNGLDTGLDTGFSTSTATAPSTAGIDTAAL